MLKSLSFDVNVQSFLRIFLNFSFNILVLFMVTFIKTEKNVLPVSNDIYRDMTSDRVRVVSVISQ